MTILMMISWQKGSRACWLNLKAQVLSTDCWLLCDSLAPERTLSQNQQTNKQSSRGSPCDRNLFFRCYLYLDCQLCTAATFCKFSIFCISIYAIAASPNPWYIQQYVPWLSTEYRGHILWFEKNVMSTHLLLLLIRQPPNNIIWRNFCKNKEMVMQLKSLRVVICILEG